jgi:hypothetical protein
MYGSGIDIIGDPNIAVLTYYGLISYNVLTSGMIFVTLAFAGPFFYV